MSSSIQRVPIAYVQGSGFFLPLTGGAAASVDIRPPAIPNVAALEVLGASSDVLSMDIPAIAAGATADVTYTYSPAGLPTSFALVKGASGIIVADIGFPVLPVGCGLIGLSKSITFGIGPSDPGSPSWVLVAVQQYQAATVGGVARWFSPLGCDAQTIQMYGQALLLCSPPQVLG